MSHRNILQCDTAKLQETPKAKQYYNIEKSIFLDMKFLNKNKIIEKEDVVIEIYKISCLISKKSYVGQAVSHILNQKKYRRYGMEKRFACHISEAYSKKKKQCRYLNNAIKKYKPKNFELELLGICKIEDADELETMMIEKHNTLFPNGYNLQSGGKSTRLTLEMRKNVSQGVMKYYESKKFEKFKDIKIPKDLDIEKFITKLNRYGKQYGWYFKYQNIKVDFGGVHESLESSKQRLINFIKKLQERE